MTLKCPLSMFKDTLVVIHTTEVSKKKRSEDDFIPLLPRVSLYLLFTLSGADIGGPP